MGLSFSWLMTPPRLFPSQQAHLPTPPARRPRRSPRPKLSIPSPSLAAADSSFPTPASEAGDEGASVQPASGACKVPAQVENSAGVAPLDSEGLGGTVGAAATAAAAAAAAPRNESEINPPANAGDPVALHDSSRSREGTISRGIEPQNGDPNGIVTDGLPPAPAPVAATAEEDGGRQPSQSSEAPVDAPGRDTVPAGLLWSDFGGGREAGEDAEETASREFAEESFGIFHGVRLESDSVSRSQVR